MKIELGRKITQSNKSIYFYININFNKMAFILFYVCIKIFYEQDFIQ